MGNTSILPAATPRHRRRARLRPPIAEGFIDSGAGVAIWDHYRAAGGKNRGGIRQQVTAFAVDATEYRDAEHRATRR